MSKNRLTTLGDCFSKIRDDVNHSVISREFKDDNKNWFQLCSCMDTMQDTHMAISYYYKEHLNKKSEKTYFEEKSEAYLLIYGIIQALILQQDSVKNLTEAIGINPIQFKSKNLLEIRDMRNSSVGHPTKLHHGQNVFSFNYISQHSMHTTGFELLSFSTHKDFVSKFVDIKKLIDTQYDELISIFNKIFLNIREREMKEKAKFKDVSLYSMLSHTFGYYMEKVSSFSHMENYETIVITFAEWGIEGVNKSLDDFKHALKQRKFDLTTEDWEYRFKYLDYAIKKIINEIEKCKNFSFESLELTLEDRFIFTKFIRSSMKELMKIAEEIDSDYVIKPRPKARTLKTKKNM